MSLLNLSAAERQAALQALRARYDAAVASGLVLDMSRGKPGPDALCLSDGLLDAVRADCDKRASDGTDTRNYGVLPGLPEARALMGELLGVPAGALMVGGNSSLQLMFDFVSMAVCPGIPGEKPWIPGKSKVLFPTPGYDRHFAVAEYFGLIPVPVPMTPAGPDMDLVERLAGSDADVVALWCVPKYSNPDGITFSDETVRRLSAMPTAFPHFRLLWDNAYVVHDLYDQGDELANLADACNAAGNPERPVQFCSTSKMCFPGGGISAVATGPATLKAISARWFVQTIGWDKLNMLRHVRFFKDADGVRVHMRKIGDILRVKFETVLDILARDLKPSGLASWHSPRGGYFISINLHPGTARRTVELMKNAGVVLTPAGATFPGGTDPADSNVRFAPSFPSIKDLEIATELFCVCAQIAALETV